jgi:hypothetical protein
MAYLIIHLAVGTMSPLLQAHRIEKEREIQDNNYYFDVGIEHAKQDVQYNIS